MEYHAIANVFPLMEGEAFQALVEDVRKHGLLEPIILYEGKILDGRNRYRACTEAGAAVRTQKWQGEGGTPTEFVWSKNAERRQLTTSQRAMAAQALLPFLEAEAKERYAATVGRPRKSAPMSEQIIDHPNQDSHTGRAAVHAAKLTGVGKSIIYEAKMLARKAETDPKAAELATQVRAGALTVSQANRMLLTAQPEDDDEYAAALRRRRSPVAITAQPPREDANEASKARYASRPVRVLADYLGGLRLDMERQGLTITDESLDAWWEGVEPREWAQMQESTTWFLKNCEPLLKFMRYKMARNSIPPMVEAIKRHEQKQARRQRA